MDVVLDAAEGSDRWIPPDGVRKLACFEDRCRLERLISRDLERWHPTCSRTRYADDMADLPDDGPPGRLLR